MGGTARSNGSRTERCAFNHCRLGLRWRRFSIAYIARLYTLLEIVHHMELRSLDY